MLAWKWQLTLNLSTSWNHNLASYNCEILQLILIESLLFWVGYISSGVLKYLHYIHWQYRILYYPDAG